MLYRETGFAIGRSQPHTVVTRNRAVSAVAVIATRFHGPLACVPTTAACIVGTSEYDGVIFPAVVGEGNLIATQFHPEKSGKHGLRLYSNFLRLALERGSIAPDGALESASVAG